MTKKKSFLIVLCIFLAAVIVTACKGSAQDETDNSVVCIENALGEQWKKQTKTEVSERVYSDEEGNTIVYYVCLTLYYNADPVGISGLNVAAISAVIDPDEAESSRECKVCDLPAAIYQKDGRAYLCWTIIPELSCVIEYDPTVESETDMFRMAESVPVNTASAVSASEP